MAQKYRIKREFHNTKKIVVIDGRGYMIDSDFLNSYQNANSLIESHKVIGERFETLEGKAVEFTENANEIEPVKAEKPKTTRKKRTTKASK